MLIIQSSIQTLFNALSFSQKNTIQAIATITRLSTVNIEIAFERSSYLSDQAQNIAQIVYMANQRMSSVFLFSTTHFLKYMSHIISSVTQNNVKIQNRVFV